MTPTNPSIALGEEQPFTATGVYDATQLNITTDVTWSSTSESVATISNASGSEGRATSRGMGSTNISAVIPGVSTPIGSATLRVTAAELESIRVTPVNPSIQQGTKQQFTALGRYTDDTEIDISSQVIWSSSDPSVASVSDSPGSDGLATSLTVGGTSIRARDSSSGHEGSTNLDVEGPTSNRAYVANASDGSVSVVDLVDGEVVDTISVADSPYGVAVHESDSLAYVTHHGLGPRTVSVIDTTRNEVVASVNVGENPQSIAINEVKDKAYVANPGAWGSGNDTVTVINTSNHQVITTVTVGEDPDGIAIADHGNSTGVFVGLKSALQVKVIDVDTNAITHTLTIPPSASGPSNIQDLAYHRATYRIYVLRESLLTSIYATTKQVVDTYQLQVPSAAAALAVNGIVAGDLYTVHPGASAMSVYEYVTHSQVTEVAVGPFPTALAVARDPHGKVLVSNCTGNSVSVVDIDTNAVVKTIAVGGCPRGVAVIH